MTGTKLASFDIFTAEVSERDSRVTLIASREGREFRAHLRNTGRLKDLIYPGATVACESKESGKTDARVIGAVDEGAYVLLDTHVQERGVSKALRTHLLDWIPAGVGVEEQVTCEGKRFDFGLRVGRGQGYMELKSAVSCDHGWASYPDAPTERGLEHVELLAELSAAGVPAWIVFVVTDPRCSRFRPNGRIQPEMVPALRAAREAGVKIASLKTILTGDGEVLLSETNVPVSLEN